MPYAWKWKEPEVILYANEEEKAYVCEVIYVSQNANYENVEGVILVKVKTANPRYEIPKEIETEQGNTLEEIKDKYQQDMNLWIAWKQN